MKYHVSIILSSTIRMFYFAKAKSYSSLYLLPLFSFYVKIKCTQVTERGKPARIIIFLMGGTDIITESLAVDHRR